MTAAVNPIKQKNKIKKLIKPIKVEPNETNTVVVKVESKIAETFLQWSQLL